MVMAEPRRLQFTTVTEKKDQKPTDTPPVTVRFSLSLTESTDETCSEFSYTELLKNVLQPKEKKVVENGNAKDKGPFGDDDVDPDEVAALARKFEEKYGPKPGKKKPHRGRIQDLVDLGEGYDESDAFIDNSEAYDEVLPFTLTTSLGGFYINSGKLEFKDMSDDSGSEFTTPMKKKKKKMRIISDSDDESNKGEKKKKIKKRKLKEGLDGEEKKRKKKRLISGEYFKKPEGKPNDKDKFKKKKLSPTVGELLKQQTESTSTPVTPSSSSNLNGGLSLLDLDINSPSSQDDLSNGAFPSNIDSVIDAVIAENRDDSNSRDMVENLTKIITDPSSIPKLPQGVSPELESTIASLKEAAKHSVDGKCKFFTNDVNSLLLKVELCCRQLPCGQRTTVYGHLAAFLPCGKDTLMKRAKKLRVSQQDDEIRGPLEKLRDAISVVMPALQEKHELECQKKTQQRLAEEKDKGEQKETKDDSEESGDEDDKSQENAGKKKIHKGPRKKFEWTDNLRFLLCDVVKVKMKMLDMAKNRTQTAEEYLKSFLEREVKPLWPKGWMQTRMLFKESRSVHASWTNPQKPKKTVIITKSNPASAPTTPTLLASALPSKIPSTLQSPNNSLFDLMGGSAKSAVGGSKPPSKSATPSHIPPSTVSAKKSEVSNSSLLSSMSYSSSGLSLLADAASHKPVDRAASERSWDHVVSDILKSTFMPTQQSKDTKTGSSPQESKSAKEQQAAAGSFMAHFQKYASDMSLYNQNPAEADLVKKLSPTQPAGKSNLTIQKQDQQQFVHKLQMATQQKTDKLGQVVQHSPQLPTKVQGQQSLQQHTKVQGQQSLQQHTKVQGQQSLQQQTKVQGQQSLQQHTKAQSLQQHAKVQAQQSSQQLAKAFSASQQISVTKSPSSSQQLPPSHRSFSDDIYKQLLESSSSPMNVTGKPRSNNPPKPINVSNPKTVRMTSPAFLPKSQHSSKVTVTKVITVGANSNSDDSKKMTVHVSKPQLSMNAPSTVQVSRTSPTAVSQRSQGSVKGLSPTQMSKQSLSSDLNSAANLLQTLFGEMQEKEKQQYPGLSSSQQQMSPFSTSPKQQITHKTPQHSSQQIWSMNSLVGNKSANASSYTVPKSVPGYQSVTISSRTQPLPQPDHSFMGVQNNYAPTSPLIGQPNPVTGQTSPNQLSGIMSPYTLASQHHSSMPYHGQYTDKSRSPHGF